MSEYHLVSTLHRARVTLADSRKMGDAAAVAAAEAQVAAARAAVDATLADGRVAFATHLLDLDLDCLGAILSHLGPYEALSTARTCTTLRSALFRGGLPGPLAYACRSWPRDGDTADTIADAVRALDGMKPALGALRLNFRFRSFGKGHARLLARALDAAPRAARIDIAFLSIRQDDAGRLADVLSSPDRAFSVAAQVHADVIVVLSCLTRAGVRVTSAMDAADLSYAHLGVNTLTQLFRGTSGAFNLSTQLPSLRKLILDPHEPDRLTTDMPSLTELAPHLKEIQFDG